MKRYQDEKPFEERCIESETILNKYPSRVPLICERENPSDPPIQKSKFLVPSDLTLAQFAFIVRKQIDISPEQALFFIIHPKKVMPSAVTEMGELYRTYRDQDGFLYIRFMKENTFGAGNGV